MDFATAALTLIGAVLSVLAAWIPIQRHRRKAHRNSHDDDRPTQSELEFRFVVRRTRQ
jgi:hypothetical protein